MIKNRGRYFSHTVLAIDKKYPTGEKLKKAKQDGSYTYKYINDHDLNVVNDETSDYNLVSSVAEISIEPWQANDNIMHYPAIDIDFPVYAVPSRTPGHTHLYIEKAISWPQYLKLLAAMADCGIVEKGYYQAAKNKGMTLLRKESYEKLLSLVGKSKSIAEPIQKVFNEKLAEYNDKKAKEVPF